MTDINHDKAKRDAVVFSQYGRSAENNLARAYFDLAARNERLREALAPFARVGEECGDADDYHDGWAGAGLRDEVFRRARAAYEESGR